ncbi:MAG: shikimate kinase [Marinagarivorans sp.]|nr:shikimate kinase [Marinagarivorans sp.]
MSTQCISLIGMAGVGKSTIGHLLAQKLNKDFIDTDTLIEHKHQQKLQQLLEFHGYLKLRELEAECICTLAVNNSIIATGGSAVYSAKAISYLKTLGPVIFLDAKLSTITARVTNFASRGLACKPGQTLEDLYNERYPLYLASGDIHIICDNKSIGEICEKILSRCMDIKKT